MLQPHFCVHFFGSDTHNLKHLNAGNHLIACLQAALCVSAQHSLLRVQVMIERQTVLALRCRLLQQ